MARIGWSLHEAAILMDAYMAARCGKLTHQEACCKSSMLLRALALNKGLIIDDKYRNENGMSIMMGNLTYVVTGGVSGMANAGQWCYDIVDLYQNNPDEYQRVLREALGLTGIV